MCTICNGQIKNNYFIGLAGVDIFLTMRTLSIINDIICEQFYGRIVVHYDTSKYSVSYFEL